MWQPEAHWHKFQLPGLSVAIYVYMYACMHLVLVVAFVLHSHYCLPALFRNFFFTLCHICIGICVSARVCVCKFMQTSLSAYFVASLYFHLPHFYGISVLLNKKFAKKNK